MHIPALFNALIPSRCLVCNGGVRGLKPLCAGCEQDLPWNVPACPRCAMPQAGATTCAECRQHPPAFARALCAFRYEAPVAVLLNRYKHHGQLAGGHLLAQALADAVHHHYREQGEPLPDAIVPVPLHWRRLQGRGFDQALETGKVLSRRLDIPLASGLRRLRHTSSQQGQGRMERQRNLAGAFVFRGRLTGRRIALIDDVLTTGSTATAIIPALQAAGAQEVHVWAIARTP